MASQAISSSCSKLSRPWLRNLVIALPLEVLQADGEDGRNDEAEEEMVNTLAHGRPLRRVVVLLRPRRDAFLN
jgi:hypothetical protein